MNLLPARHRRRPVPDQVRRGQPGAGDPGERFSVVLTNPPFGKKSSIAIVNEEGDLEKEDPAYERQDFWTTTKNKQLNFLQHVKTLLKSTAARDRRARQRALRGRRRRDGPPQPAQAVRRAHAAATADRHLLRPGREGQRAVLRRQAGPGEALDEKAVGLRPADEHALHAQRQPAEAGRPGRVRRLLSRRRTATNVRKASASSAFDYDDLIKRDKVNLDIFWLKDKSLEDSDDLPRRT